MTDPASKQACPDCGLEIPVGSACPGCCLRLALSPEAMTPLEAQRPLPAGLKSRFFGDYKIIDEIARGGMGVVYRARQLGLNRLVALKMIQTSHLLSEEARLRFRVEIEAVAQLHHPHIVSLYESGEHDGAHYFTMRLVEGGDLAAQLKQDQPLRECIRLLVKVCRAVHYAHQRGILHRDLKPSNILVDQQGEPHVADFGLAKSLDHDSGFTFTSSVLGSPNYMAPEQATGKTRQLTIAVDVYGLGAILYHVLAGCPPFQAKTPIETLRQVVDNDPQPPRSFNAHVDPDLETIALKCLRKEPAARYGTAEELALDLERWLAGEPILARPLGPLAAAWRWSRRHPAVATLGAALMLALAVIVIGTGVAAVQIQRAERQSAASLRESLLREAASFRLGGELGHREQALALLRQASSLGGAPEFHSRLRNEVLAALARTDIAFAPAPFSNAPSALELVRLDKRFERVAMVEEATNVVIRIVASGAVTQRIAADGPVVRVECFSPNGRFLAVRQTNSLTIWELETGTRCLAHAGTNNTFAFAPHEDTVLLQDNLNEAVLFELSSGRERLRWASGPGHPAYRSSGWHTLSFSPDGKTVAGASGLSPMVELINPLTGERMRVVTNYTATASPSHTVAMAWSRHGGALAIATADGRIYNWNPRTGERRWVSSPMIAPARSITYHPGGDWVAAVCENEQMRYFDDLAQGFVFEHPAAGERIEFSPDGSRLGPLRTGEIWGWLELRPAREYAEFRVAQSGFQFWDARFSTDGRMLAVGHSDHVFLIDAERGTRFRERSDWRTSACVFHPSRDELFVGGTDGLMRYRHSFSQPGRLSFSRGERIHAGSNWQAFDFSADGRFLAAFNARSNAAFVFDQTFTNRLAILGPVTNVGTVAISPDGRWVTTGAHAERMLRLWDVATGRLIEARPMGRVPQGAFSADGRWLALMGGQGFHLLETGTWKPAPQLPLPDGRPVTGAAAFSPDGHTLALVVDQFTVQLIDLRRFESLGILRPPGATPLRGLAFSADGSRLAAVGPEARVAVWKLRDLQERLTEFQLGWSKH